MTKRESQLHAFGKLLDIMDELREKCPWDKKQTMNLCQFMPQNREVGVCKIAV